MERLALIGVSHRRGGAAALETWQSHFHPGALADLDETGIGEWVPIVTCNRWDLIVALPSELSIGDARTLLTPQNEAVSPYAYVGDGALEQLCRIAASLDSLNPGEDQIMAQVREAFADAQTRGSTGKVTSFAFNTALRVAKRVRREIELAPMHTSLFSLAKPELESYLGPGAKVAVLGAGQMGTLAAKSLRDIKDIHLTIINRSYDRAHQLANHLGVESLSLDDFTSSPPPFDALVCALSAKEWINTPLLEKLPHLKVIVDLGIPRNVTPEVAERMPILNIDTLQKAGEMRREAITLKLAEAERLIQEELELALTEWTERQLGTSIKHLRDWYLETIGDSLPPEDAAKLAHKFAHVPIKGLRAVAREYGLDAAKVFLAETGIK